MRFFFIFILISVAHIQTRASDWLQCWLLDFEGYEDTIYLLDKGALYVHYLHPNVAPVNFEFSLDGESRYTHVTNLPELVDGLPPENVQGNIKITQETQQNLGVGNYTLSLKVIADDATHWCNKTFDLIKEVRGVYVTTNKWFVATNEEFHVKLYLAAGLPSFIEWVVRDSGGSTVLRRDDMRRDDSSPHLGKKMSLPDAGSYTVQVTVYNDLSIESDSVAITVQQPVSLISMTTDSPRQFPDAGVNFVLQLHDDPLPSAARYDIAYGDGLKAYDISIPDGVSNVSLQHNYTSPGLYNVKVSVFNKISMEIIIASVGILEDISDISLVAYTQKDNYITPLQVLPREYLVKFVAKANKGTIEYATWNMDSTQTNTTSTKTWYKFPAVSWYNVSVTLANSFTGKSTMMSINILESVTSLYLVNNGPVNLEKNITYVLFCKQQGSTPSYRVDLGDGTVINLPIPQKNPDITSYLPSNLKIPFDPLQYYATIFTHRYEVEGRYVAIATGFNPVSQVTSESEAFIQLRPCQIPDINIRDGGSNFNSATKYKRNKSFMFAAYVTLDCQGAKRAKYQYRIYTIDDINAVPSPTNQLHLPPTINSEVTDLYIPKYMLDYGGYIFELTVVMEMKDGTIGVSSRDQSYIEVAQSQLVPKISGGSSIVVGWSTNITIDGSESFDPDWPGEFDGEFSWYCHLPNETLPFVENNVIPNEDDLPEDGGCLGLGYHLQSGNSSKLFIAGKTFLGNRTYIFHLAISKPGRNNVGWAKQTVLVMPGFPPALVIRCLHNCDRFVNPSERFALLGQCTDCDKETKNIYTWTILSDSALQQHLIGFRRVFHGRRKAYLSLPVETFVGSQTYTIRLKIDSWNGASSRAEYTFTTNSAPTMGTCSVSPLEGIVLQTKFNIECNGFMDTEGPLMYEAHASTGDESTASGGVDKGTLVYYGVDPNFPPTLLPIGQPSQDFNVAIHIKVSDTLGASVGLSMVVKVKVPAVEDQTELVEDTVLRLAQGEESELSQLVDSGSLQSATQLITTMTSMLNAEADKTEEDVVKKDAKKEKRKQARDSLINTLVRVEVRDMESLEQTSAAMAQVTQEKQEVSIQAQVKMTGMYQGMGQFLKEQSDSGVGGEVVESSARLLVSGLSNMMGAAFTQIEQINSKTQNDTENENKPELNEEQLEERTSKARDVTLSALSTLKDVQAAILHNKVPGEEPAELVTDSLSVLLGRQENWQLNGLGLESKDGGFSFQLPIGMDQSIQNNEGVDSDTIIDTQMYHFQNNPYSWASDSSQVTSQVTSLQLTQADQSELSITNLPNDINIILTNNNASAATPLVPSINPATNQTLYIFNYTNINSSVLILVEPKAYHQSDRIQRSVEPDLKLCIQFGFPPNSTHNAGCTTLPREIINTNDTSWNATLTVDLYSWLLHPEDMVDVGQYYISIQKEHNSEDLVDLDVYAHSAQCLFWDEKQEVWTGDGCKVGPYTSLTHTHCQCNHLTSFALSFFVLPNALDLAKDIALFLQFLDNPVSVVAVVVVFILYAVIAIWAKRKDRIEDKRAKVIYLQDNDPRAHYRYHVTVFTGMRKNAGTSAVVTITLYGSFGSSNPHILRPADQDQEILQRNSCDSFILTTHQSLGHVTSVRVWHDNSGPAPEWYASRILVHDLESDLWWYFLCRSWLAVDLYGSRIDKTFPVATQEDLNEFSNLVLSKTIRDIKDNHLWFSIFIKPPQSYFTRLQRASCCLVILLTSMVISIMFYDVPADPERQDYEFGSIQISVSNIIVGIQASLLSIPISTAVMAIFRYSRPRYVAVPDPLQAHAGSELSLLGHGMKHGVRRLTRYLSQQFHHGTKTNSNASHDILPDHIDVDSSMVSSRSRTSSSSEIISSQSSDTSFVKKCRAKQTLPDSLAPKENVDISRLSKDTELGKLCDGKKDTISTSVIHISEVNASHWSTSTDSSVFENQQKEANGTKWKNGIGAGDVREEVVLQEEDFGNSLMDNHESAFAEESHLEVFDKTAQSEEDNEAVSSSSWDLSDGTVMEYETHQDYLFDKLTECRELFYNPMSSKFADEDCQKKASRKLDLILKLHGWEESSDKDEHEDDEEDTSDHGFLPWWCIYVAWFLTISSSIVCAFFIMQYGLRYGWQTSLDWLVAMMVSFIQSVVIVQPIKVVVMAIVFAVTLKSHEVDDVGAQFFRNWKLPKITASSEEAAETMESVKRYNYLRAIHAPYYKPPATTTVIKFREKRRIAAKVQSMFRAFLGQLVFVFFVLEIAYTQQNTDSFFLGKALRDKYNDGLEEVSTFSDFHGWMSEEFIPTTYGGDIPMELQDGNMLVGEVRLRQVRVKPGVCTVPPDMKTQFPKCKSPINKDTIDRDSYGPAWAYKSSDKGKGLWDYQSGRTVVGSYYGMASMGFDNGGYIANLGARQTKALDIALNLQETSWANEHTWALFLEWTIYNANTNLFSVNTILFEVDTLGALRGSAEFSIVRLYRYTSQYDIFVRVLEATYVIIVLVMMYRDYHKWKELGREYFDFWNGLNVVTIVVSICAISLYALRHVIGVQAMDDYKQNRNQFISFSRVAFINQVVITLIGVVVFCGTLKCAKVLRYNSSFFMLHQALHNVFAQFVSFSFGICVSLMCFASYAFLVFSPSLSDFHTFLASVETLFIAITGGIEKIEGLVDEFPIQSFLFIVALSFFGIFILFQLYVSFILAAFEEARRHPMKCRDHDVVTVIIDWIIDRFAIDRPAQEEEEELLVSK